MSKILSKPALNAISRIGDIIIPHSEDFPSFSEAGGLEHIDDIMNYTPADDAKDLNLVLSILSFLPTFMLKALVKSMLNSNTKTGPVSVILRQLDMGLRGIVFSCYYSGKTGSNFKGKNPLDIIEYKITRLDD